MSRVRSVRRVVVSVCFVAAWFSTPVSRATAQTAEPHGVPLGPFTLIAVPAFDIADRSSTCTVHCKSTEPLPAHCKICDPGDATARPSTEQLKLVLEKLLRLWCQASCSRNSACLTELFVNASPVSRLPSGMEQEACEVGFTQAGIATIGSTIKGTVRKSDTFTRESRREGPTGPTEMSLYFSKDNQGCWIMKIEL